MSKADSAPPPLSGLGAAAEQARAALDWGLAIMLYSQALEAAGRTPADRYELLDARAECHRKLSNFDAQLADLEAMERLAADLGDETRRARSLRLQVRPHLQKGHQARARQAAETALALARELGERSLEAESLAEMAGLCVSVQEWAQSQQYAECALALARELGDLNTQARSLVAMGYAARSLSLAAQAEGYRQEALDLFRRLGAREEEGNVLSNLGYAATDAAQQRAYYEQALVAYEAAGSRERRHYLYNLLALAYWRLGLYARARDYAERAVSFMRKRGARLALVYSLETLARIYLALGDQERARAAYEEDLALSQEFSDAQSEWYASLGLGLMALGGGHLSEAQELLQRASELSVAANSPVDQATNLAWLGAVDLALGEVTAARAHTAEAVARLDLAAGASGEFPPQDVWWWRYQSLISSLPLSDPAIERQEEQERVGDEGGISDSAWQALDRARAAMLEYVTALSDDGLRRNYLGKAGLNRQIIREWLGQAGRRGQSLAPLTGALSGQGGLRGQFQRILEIGVRLNAQRDAADLPRFIMDEVVELTGAERAVLLLLDENGLRHVAAVVGEIQGWLDSITPFLDEVSLKRAPLLRYLPEGALALEQRSELCVPLLAQGRLIGLIHVSLAGTFGHFTPQDCDMLTVLANQAAVAVVNARWTGTLERRVEERTAELAEATQRAQDARALAEQANRERGALLDEMVRQNQYLAALHATTVGLISRLNVNELLEALVTRAGQLLDAPHGFIYLAEPGEAELECKVGVGVLSQNIGSRRSPGEGLAGKVWQAGGPLVVDDYDRWPGRIDRLEAGNVGAIMGVPLKSGGHVVGAIGLARDRGTGQTFGKEELGVLNRFAELASVALDNARLYSAAQESQRRLADIIDFLPDATLVIDREGKVIAWNRTMEEMTGVKAEKMLGKGNYEYSLPFYGQRRPILIDLVLLPDEEIEKMYAHLQRSEAILQGEALVPQLQGEPAYLYATASALRNSKGEIVGAIETIRDITDRRRAEEELREAKAVAEAATQAKSAFLATMSHEIRTPMNAVIGMTSLLLDTALSPEQREFAETIRTSGDALLSVINDILDFSKIEARRIELDHQPFDVRECVESALGLVAGQASAKELELGCWIDPQVPAGIAGDETRLRQILLNLLSNAVKFTERGEVEVSVGLGGIEEEQDLPSAAPVLERDEGVGGKGGELVLHFSVRDTGLGIPADRRDRLFQSFSQVDSSTTRRFGGTGLGLVISQRLAELMGGQIWVESTGIAGQGSTFHLALRAETAAIPSRAELQAEAPDLRGQRVLIVDDSATSRRILTLQTQGWGMLPHATGSPSEALEWVQQGEAFDLAIVDRQMPELDGVMLAAAMRKLRDAQALPLVMLSSLGKGEAEETAEFAAVLVKPVRASQLYNTLASILARCEARVVSPPVTAPQFDGEMGKRQPLRILLAEDNAVNQKLALRLLERLGYRADVAANGVEVIRAVERQPYDVVFMDVQMPEMDGLEATRQICARWASGERPRIIAMTANAMQEDREACLAAGMDDYLAKPIRIEELIAALSGSTIQERH